MTTYLLCSDWGTSSFRLRLVDADNLKVYAEIESADDGISKTFNTWKEYSNWENITRYDFFTDKLKKNIDTLAERCSVTLKNVPVVISGMASSSIGMEEVPYASLPFSTKGTNASLRFIEKNTRMPHSMLLISGVKGETDVMRGEEAQIVGLHNLKEVRLSKGKSSVFILPGTHSKHVYVKDEQIVGFQTFMTGELFSLLTEHSILKDSITLADSSELLNSDNNHFFRLGVKASAFDSILHSLFSVRTNHLFGKLTAAQNFFFLSGLLIGSELRALRNVAQKVFCCDRHLFYHYNTAVEELGLPNDYIFIPPDVVEKATIAGQVQIFKQNIIAKTLNE